MVKSEVKISGPGTPDDKKEDETKTGEGKKKQKRPIYARPYDEKKIMNAIKCPPPRHDWFGFIFSAQSARPPPYYHNYFLPTYDQPSERQHVHIVGEQIPADKIMSVADAPKPQLPLATVKIQWGLKRTCTVYKLENLYNYLTRFGPVDAVYPNSINSAVVVFTFLHDARSVIKCQNLGTPWDPLIATWVEPRLNNYSFFNKYASTELDDDTLFQSTAS